MIRRCGSHRTSALVPVLLALRLLRALDYFQLANAPRDEHLAVLLKSFAKSRLSDGRWPLQDRYRGKTYFELERLARLTVGTLSVRFAC